MKLIKRKNPTKYKLTFCVKYTVPFTVSPFKTQTAFNDGILLANKPILKNF